MDHELPSFVSPGVRVEESNVRCNEDGTRQGKILTLLGITGFDDDDGVRDRSIYTTVSAFLAWKQLDTRSGAILPHLPALLEGCDIHWSYEARDTNFAPLQAIRQLLEATHIETAEVLDVSAADLSGSDQSQYQDQEVAILAEEEKEQIDNATQAPLQPPTQPPMPPQASLPNPPLEDRGGAKPRTPPPFRTEPHRTLPPRETDPPLTEEQYLNWGRIHSLHDNNENESSRHPDAQQQQQQAEDGGQSTRLLQGSIANSPSHPGNSLPMTPSPQSPVHSQSTQDDGVPPFAMIGAFSSRVSQTLGILGDALAIPQISGSSTSADLTSVPLFARTITTDDAMAEAFIHYMKSLHVSHFANIYVKDSYGTSFHQSLQRYADHSGIRLQGISYEQGKEMEVIDNLKEIQLRFVFATVVEWYDLIQAAYERQVIGVSGYAWFLSEKYILTSSTFELSKASGASVAQALSGIGLINVYGEAQDELFRAFMDFADATVTEDTNSTTLQKEYIASHSHPEIFDDYIFPPYTPSANQHFYFDAVVALGLASCQTPGLFTGNELYEQLLKLDFQGVTGRVSFDGAGNRKLEGVKYRVDNLRLSENRSDLLHYGFEYSRAAVISGSNVTEVNTFLFPNGDGQFTMTIPTPLPPVEEDFNFIEPWARTTGFVLGSCVMCLSLVIMCLTWWKRNAFIIKASQPPFLVQLCSGTLILSATVFPLSLGGGGEDESTNLFKYNAACTSVHWFLSLGFVTSFSAILAKTWRLNTLMNAGHAIRRIKVKAKDVLKPFFILLTINVMMLLGLTFVAPFEFQRTPLNDYDAFGRSVASYGSCRASSNLVYVFFVPMVLANTVGVLVAAWQCYVARSLPLEFSETHYLSISMASLLETIVLSSPVLIALEKRPTSFYAFACVAVCLLTLSSLVPVFLPKWWHRHYKAQRGRTQANLIAENTRHKKNTTTFASRPDILDLDVDIDNHSANSGSTYGKMRIHRKEKSGQ